MDDLTEQTKNILALLGESNAKEQLHEMIADTLKWACDLGIGFEMKDCVTILARLGYDTKNTKYGSVSDKDMNHNARRFEEMFKKTQISFSGSYPEIDFVLGLFSRIDRNTEKAVTLEYIEDRVGKTAFASKLNGDGVKINKNTIRILITAGLAGLFTEAYKKGIRWSDAV